MIPYIVKGTVSVTPYMNDTYTVEDIRIVMANNTAEAYDKRKLRTKNRGGRAIASGASAPARAVCRESTTPT